MTFKINQLMQSIQIFWRKSYYCSHVPISFIKIKQILLNFVFEWQALSSSIEKYYMNFKNYNLIQENLLRSQFSFKFQVVKFPWW